MADIHGTRLVVSTKVFDNAVPQMQVSSFAPYEITDDGFRGILNGKIGLGSLPIGISFGRKPEDLLVGNIAIARNNSENDGSCFLDVSLHHVLHQVDIGFGSKPWGDCLEHAWDINDRKVIGIGVADFNLEDVEAKCTASVAIVV
ncbi:hypothetical protein MKX08_005668 [Trichoderma sp. CBMAI-0020]|nr:hypothetical protein MKX08_005668 [Trichoderma sp. CBMAI-0020]